MDRVIVSHRMDWARGTTVAGLAGRVYKVGPDGQLCDADGPGVHPDDATEFRRFRVFAVTAAKPKSPPAPPPPPTPPPEEPVKPRKKKPTDAGE